MRVLAVWNAQGGVGKTTTAVSLADGWRRQGRRVLLVDLDPLGSATEWLMGAEGLRGRPDTVEVLLKGRLDPQHVARIAKRPGLDLLPSSLALVGVDAELAKVKGGQRHLAGALARHAARWDLVVLDCPPVLGMAVLFALAASDAVLVPVLPSRSPLSLLGLRVTSQAANSVRKTLSTRTPVLGYVLFGADARKTVTDEAREELRATGLLLRGEVRVSAPGMRLARHGLTCFDEASGDERGREDFGALLRAVAEHL